MLLIVGIVLVVLALLGFVGAIRVLRSVAWMVLLAAIVVIALSFFV